MEVDIDVDLTMYSIDAIKNVCYRYADNSPSTLAKSNNKITITFSLPDNYTSAKIKEFTESFNADVLDSDLREKIRSETEATRNLILAYAFSDSALIEE